MSKIKKIALLGLVTISVAQDISAMDNSLRSALAIVNGWLNRSKGKPSTLATTPQPKQPVFQQSPRSAFKKVERSKSPASTSQPSSFTTKVFSPPYAPSKRYMNCDFLNMCCINSALKRDQYLEPLKPTAAIEAQLIEAQLHAQLQEIEEGERRAAPHVKKLEEAFAAARKAELTLKDMVKSDWEDSSLFNYKTDPDLHNPLVKTLYLKQHQ